MMSSTCDFLLPNTRFPSLSSSSSSSFWTGLKKNQSSLLFPFLPHHLKPIKFRSIQAIYQNPNPSLFPKPHGRNPSVSAGRSKKTPGGASSGRIEGDADVRRQAKRNARRKSRRLVENLFYRLKNPGRNHANNFSEEELQMIGLGYDRMVRFMEKDDPNLRHPYDWYKYGEYGPYSWRGIVVGDPIRGRLSDENVTLIGEVRDHEEWEKIERHEMGIDFSERMKMLDKDVGLKYFWVFVRHPKWKIGEMPWEQWSLVCEVVVQTGEKRLDKWNLMGRLGNMTRTSITQCAAWERPDIIYVKRPVYQCRFEPQDGFFRPLGPLLDPATENDYKFKLRLDDGRVEMCTYFGGLCKIVRVNPKAFVDDVVNGYEKMSDERKSMCLEFLLSNHPMELLHPYTKEWKAKLEEMELGCDAPDEEEEGNMSGPQIVDWIEDDDNGSDDDDEYDDDSIDGEDDENTVVDAGDDGDDEVLGMEEERPSAEENTTYWDQQFEKALRSPEAMEKLVKKSVETSSKFYKKQLREMDDQVKERSEMEGNVGVKDAEVIQHSEEKWENVGNYGRRRRVKRGKIPPGLFLRAAVRPFNYRNLVKEIVLMRHAIIDGEISGKR